MGHRQTVHEKWGSWGLQNLGRNAMLLDFMHVSKKAVMQADGSTHFKGTFDANMVYETALKRDL